METLKVSSRSNPNSVAGAMAGVIRSDAVVEVQVVGAGALNQAIKAVAITRGYLAPSGLDIVCVPTFADIEIDGQGRTAIRLTIEDRSRRAIADGDGHVAAHGHGKAPASSVDGDHPDGDSADIDLTEAAAVPSPDGDGARTLV